MRRILKRWDWESRDSAGEVWAVVNENVLGEIVAGMRARNVVSPAIPKNMGFMGGVLRSLVRMPMRGGGRS